AELREPAPRAAVEAERRAQPFPIHRRSLTGAGALRQYAPQRRSRTATIPGTLTAPGPGRPANESKKGLPVAGTQKVPARLVAKTFRLPKIGEPDSVTRLASPPNAPGIAWPGQKFPAGSARVDVPVSRRERLASRRPKN